MLSWADRVPMLEHGAEHVLFPCCLSMSGAHAYLSLPCTHACMIMPWHARVSHSISCFHDNHAICPCWSEHVKCLCWSEQVLLVSVWHVPMLEWSCHNVPRLNCCQSFPMLVWAWHAYAADCTCHVPMLVWSGLAAHPFRQSLVLKTYISLQTFCWNSIITC